MTDELFIILFTVGITAMLVWGFRKLPGERWQILAALPRTKTADGGWAGENLTFYGLFNANAYTLALALFLVMLGAAGVPMTAILTAAALLLVVCIPASRQVARVVEKKRYTFTVGGAAFVGILIAPAVVGFTNLVFGAGTVTAIPFLAALSIAYAFGEGVGRLACISFGCCYGKPLSRCHPRVQKIFRRCSFVFTGKTKKIAYADGLDGEPVMPIQAVTAVLYCVTGLAGFYLFIKGFFTSAFLLALTVTQIWRIVSEFFRADYRGGRKFTAYQMMGIGAVLYALALAVLIPVPPVPVRPALLAGLRYLWHPGTVLLLQGLWIGTFLYTGRSRVTDASLSFRIIRNRV